MFQDLDRRSALSPGTLGLAVVLTIGAVLTTGNGLWEWLVEGKAMPLPLLCGPAGALSAWMVVQSEREWSAKSQRRLSTVGLALMMFFAVLTVYGAFAWYRHGGDSLLPIWSAAYFILWMLGSWRRSQRASHAG